MTATGRQGDVAPTGAGDAQTAARSGQPGPRLSVSQPDAATVRLTLAGVGALPPAPLFALRRDDGTYFDPNGGRAQSPLPFPAPHRRDGDRLAVDLPDLLWLTATDPGRDLMLEVWRDGDTAPMITSAPWPRDEEASPSPVPPPVGSEPEPRQGRRINRLRLRPGSFAIDPLLPNQLAPAAVTGIEASVATDVDGDTGVRVEVAREAQAIRIDLPAGAPVLHRLRYRLDLADAPPVVGDIRILYFKAWVWAALGLFVPAVALLLWWLTVSLAAPLLARDDRVTLAAGGEALVDFLANDRLPGDPGVSLGPVDACGVSAEAVGAGRATRARLQASTAAVGDCAIPYRLTGGGLTSTAVIRARVEPRPLHAREDRFAVPRNGSLALDLIANDELPAPPARAAVTVELDREGLIGELRETDVPGQVRYIAPYGVEQADRFRYRLTSDGQMSEWAQVEVQIGRGASGSPPPTDLPKPREPIGLEAVDDRFDAATGLPRTFDVLANDRFDRAAGAPPPGLTLTRSATGVAASLSPDGRLRIDTAGPAAGAAAVLEYRLTQADRGDTAQVTVQLPPPAAGPTAPPPGSATACRSAPGEPAFVLIPKGQYARPANPGRELARGLDAFAQADIDLGGPDGGFPVVLEQDICLQREEVSARAYFEYADHTPGQQEQAQLVRGTMEQMKAMMKAEGTSDSPVFSLASRDAEGFLAYMQRQHRRDYRLPSVREWLAALLYAVANRDQALEVSLRRRVREFSADRTAGGQVLALGPSEMHDRRWIEEADPAVPVLDAGLRLVRPPEAP
ncbi:hypothetical protein THSYN_09935 [Candidatus Thiodictyon syntrophicum]|uniref:Uncharacterized protein n=1 Tax=Candidatus Thiodictyon syntrophicum TaxID=1166950 RepID=A0A2K8U861_9GAMM|nr:hypothetical protein THSYN_09935 [Candidatus Thiodictyon syntrophicum]